MTILLLQYLQNFKFEMLCFKKDYINCLAQNCSNPIVNALR